VDLVIVGLIAAGLALPAHVLLRSFAAATLISGVVASGLNQVLVWYRFGAVDKFLVPTIIATAVIGCMVSAIVGGGVRSWRRTSGVARSG
jgi:uncharacterized membrane protein YfcA